MDNPLHYAYAFGDFSNALIEMADLSAIDPKGERTPRFRRLEPAALLTRDQLNAEVENVHDLLVWIAEHEYS